MSARRQPNIFSIPPSAPFLPTFVDALLAGRLVPGLGAGVDPLALARITLYVPTRRAARALPALFQARLGRSATLLPAIRALGDVDEDVHLLRSEAADPQLPPALPEMHRKMAMTRLVHAWEGALRREVLELGTDAVLRTPASAADAAWLAGDLLALMDEMETEEVPWDGLTRLVPDDHARYWQITLDFLKIAMTYWPAHLADRGAMNPKARRSALIRREAQRLRETPPTGPVIVAGATGSVPATAELLRAVADLEQGAIVLPGFDTNLDNPSWRAILGTGEGDGEPEAHSGGVPSHPQYGMAHVVVGLGVDRSEIASLATGSLRDRIVSEALRPAQTTDAWPDLAARVSDPDRATAFEGVDLLSARNEAEEALAIAIVLRGAVEEGTSAALITPDRTLARRVAVELRRWGLQADDSAGRPLDQTPPGVLARLAGELALGGLEPVPLLALLKHPLTRLGLPANEIRAAARALERAVLRGPRARSGTEGLLDGVRAARALAEADGAGGRSPRWRRLHAEDWDVVEDLVVRLSDALAPLETFVPSGGEDVDDGSDADAVALARAHEEVLRRLCRDEAGEHGELYAVRRGTDLQPPLPKCSMRRRPV